MAENDEMQREHQKTWDGFVKLMIWSVVVIVVILALMGIFLV